MLIVNTGRLSKQVEQCRILEELYQKYKDKGFVVLGLTMKDREEEKELG